MTSRDFRLIANIIANYTRAHGQCSSAQCAHNLATAFADYLATTNDRFDRVRFIRAALGAPERPGDSPREGDYR